MDVKVQIVSTLDLECKELETEKILQRTVRVTHSANMLVEVLEIIVISQLLFCSKLRNVWEHFTCRLYASYLFMLCYLIKPNYLITAFCKQLFIHNADTCSPGIHFLNLSLPAPASVSFVVFENSRGIMSRQRGARSRSRSRDSFDRGRGPIINTPERDLALSGLSTSEKECMLACLSVEMGWMESLPSHQQLEELINKLDDLFHFIDNGYIVDDWSPPPNSVETISQFFTLMNEVRGFYNFTITFNMQTVYQTLVGRASGNGPDLFNGRRETLGRGALFTGLAYKLD